MKVTGILSLSKAVQLHYPFPVVVSSLSRMCCDVIVGVDPTHPEDRKVIESMGLPNIQIVDSVWDRENRKGGTEIAIKMDELTALAKKQLSDWVVVMQADEVLHDKDFKRINSFMERYIETDVNGFSMERVYFWKDLDTVREDWQAKLVRVFKPGTYSFMAEGTDKSGMFSAPTLHGSEIELLSKIYHYSRVDTAEIISKRVRNLDSLFHADETLIDVDSLPEYDFITREFDNFSKIQQPKKVKGKIVKFTDTHPPNVKEWYSE